MSIIVKVGDKVEWEDGSVGMVTYVKENEFQVYWAEDDTLIDHYSPLDVFGGKMKIIESEND